jgi:rhodanese-related sulfurtransferase
LAAVSWTTVYVGLGALFRFQVTDALQVLADAGVKALLVLVALVALAVVFRWVRRRRARTAGAGMLMTAHELAGELAQGDRPLLLDVRGRIARDATGSVPGSVVADIAYLSHAVQGVSKEAAIVTYSNCPNEVSALRAARSLQVLGFRNLRVLAGGFDAWEELRLENGASGPGGTLNAPAPADSG